MIIQISIRLVNQPLFTQNKSNKEYTQVSHNHLHKYMKCINHKLIVKINNQKKNWSSFRLNMGEITDEYTFFLL